MKEQLCKLKICGLFRPSHITYVNHAKPDYAGFIMDFPRSHRSLDLTTAQSLISRLEPSIQAVCVFVDKDIDFILQCKDYAQVIQLHGHETDAFIDQLKIALPDKEIWKAFQIDETTDFTEIYNSHAHMVLLDNGYGTGETFDWTYLDTFPRPFILAGGLHIDNVTQAIQAYHPYGVDISSGVEEDRDKNEAKIWALTEKVKQGELREKGRK